MTDETISEKCETLYNKLNTFVKKVINRDVQPQIDDLESDVNSLNNSITNIYEASGTFITNSCFTYRKNLGNFRRVGNVVQFEMGDNVKATNKTTRGATYTYLTIPDGFKPVQNMYMQNMYWLNNEKEHQITFIAQPNGSLVARVWWTQSTQQDVGLMIGATWITNDTTPSQ